MVVEAVVEAVEEVEVAEVEAQRQAEQQPQEEEEMQNSSEQNHPPSTGIDKTSTGSFRIFKDTCP